MPRKFASLEDIYARTVRLAEVNLSAAPQSPTISASHAISEGTGQGRRGARNEPIRGGRFAGGMSCFHLYFDAYLRCTQSMCFFLD